eukprot:626533-Pelagomonas_calceolata.AAC.1
MVPGQGILWVPQCGRRGSVGKRSCAQKVRHTFDGESRPNTSTIAQEKGTFLVLHTSAMANKLSLLISLPIHMSVRAME